MSEISNNYWRKFEKELDKQVERWVCSVKKELTDMSFLLPVLKDEYCLTQSTSSTSL